MITLIGSQGNVDFNSDGTRLLNGENTAYPDIIAINKQEWLNRYPGETLDNDCAHDILDFGTYYVDGTYDPPCDDRIAEVTWEICPECGGAGEVDVLWDQGYHPGLSNEEAEAKAGTVHHTEQCMYCGGRGEVYE